MTIIEPVTTKYHYIEYELNRLAGTLVNDSPTLGNGTAALWWLGHRGLNWALENRLTPNQATSGSALKTTDGFSSPDCALSVVEQETMIGSESVQVRVPSFPMLEVVQKSPTQSQDRQAPVAYLVLEPRIEVKPLHIYTAAAMIKADQASYRGTSFIFDWYDEAGELISSVQGDSWVSKVDEWTQMWVTAGAPETGVASVQIKIRWEDVVGGEAFTVDKMIFHNSSDVQAWAFPGAGSTNFPAGLQAHLNMKAGIFNPDEFLSVEDICNRLANIVEAAPADALSLIPTPSYQ